MIVWIEARRSPSENEGKLVDAAAGTDPDKFAEEVESDLAVEFKLFSPKLAFLSLPW